MTKQRESWEMKRGKVAFGWTPGCFQKQSRGSCNPEQTAKVGTMQERRGMEEK